MTREKELQEATFQYAKSNPICREVDGKIHEDYDTPSTDFIAGALWADKHPKKGLVDVEKVCNYLTENCKGFILTAKDIEEFRKSMTE